MTYPRKGRFGLPKLLYTPLPTMEEYLLEKEGLLFDKGYLKNIRLHLGHFANFAQREGIAHPSEITRMHLVKFHTFVNTSHWAPNTRALILKHVRAWIRWLVAVGYLETDPWVHLKISIPPKKPNPLTEDDVIALFAAHRRNAFTIPAFRYHRRELLLAVFYAWGLRLSEVAALNNSAFDPRQNFVSAINKGGGSKNLPYTDELKKIYNRYAGHRARYAKLSDDALFISETGERLSSMAIYKIIKRLAASAGIDLHPHMLRDTAGTTMLNDNIPVERVAKILGHTNIKQTLAYSEVRDKGIHDDVSRSMNPRLHFLSTGDLPTDEKEKT